MSEILTKVCSKCGEEKPLEEFSRNKNKSDGLQIWCKGCWYNYRTIKRNIFLSDKNKEKHDKPTIRICKKCKVVKPLEEFALYKKDGVRRHNICKECVRKYNKQYHIDNREYRCESSKKYRIENPDLVREAKRKCYINNEDHYIEHQRDYYSKNKGKINARNKEYYKTPMGKMAESRVKHNRRKRINEQPATLNIRGWNEILKIQNNRCANCGEKFNENLKPTKDHIIPVKLRGGFTKGNIQALCHRCNASKSASVYFIQWLYKFSPEVN